jgi:hypothetical protein
LTVVNWDLLAWLPFDPATNPGSAGTTGLAGEECWQSVFPDVLFSRLVEAALETPADIVMSLLRPLSSAVDCQSASSSSHASIVVLPVD